MGRKTNKTTLKHRPHRQPDTAVEIHFQLLQHCTTPTYCRSRRL